MHANVWVHVSISVCLLVTHFFDNAHFAFKHVLVDFLLSKVVSFGSVALRLARSYDVVLYSYFFAKKHTQTKKKQLFWPLFGGHPFFVIVVLLIFLSFAANEKYVYRHDGDDDDDNRLNWTIENKVYLYGNLIVMVIVVV